MKLYMQICNCFFTIKDLKSLHAEKSKILRDLEKVEKPLEEKSEYSASDKKMLEELTCDLMYSNPATSKYADYITSYVDL